MELNKEEKSKARSHDCKRNRAGYRFISYPKYEDIDIFCGACGSTDKKLTLNHDLSQ